MKDLRKVFVEIYIVTWKEEAAMALPPRNVTVLTMYFRNIPTMKKQLLSIESVRKNTIDKSLSLVRHDFSHIIAK